MLESVLLTHLHSDHICDLNDVDHHAVGDEPGAEAVAHLRPAPHARRRRRADGDARARRRLPARAPRRSHWEPQLEVTEVEPGVVLDDDSGAHRRRRDRSPPGRADARVPRRARGQRGRDRGRHRAVRGARRAVRGRRRVRADRAARRPRVAGADAAVPRHDRLPLDGRAGGADRGARRRGHARADAPGPDARRRAPPTSGSRSRRSTSAAR